LVTVVPSENDIRENDPVASVLKSVTQIISPAVVVVSVGEVVGLPNPPDLKFPAPSAGSGVAEAFDQS
jgi:hypothetical protein